MANFLKKAFQDMKESAKAQHQVDKANMEAVKAEVFYTVKIMFLS